jgi:hypothetical protein
MSTPRRPPVVQNVGSPTHLTNREAARRRRRRHHRRPAKATMHLCQIGPGGTKYNSRLRQLVLNTTYDYLISFIVGLLLQRGVLPDADLNP